MKHTNTTECARCNKTLETADARLVAFAKVIRAKNQEAHVSWAYRGEKDQNDALARGTSKVAFGQSPHNFKPAQAVDWFRLTPNGEAEWNGMWLTNLLQRETLNHGLVWGGSFKTFKDAPHVETKDWRSLRDAQKQPKP